MEALFFPLFLVTFMTWSGLSVYVLIDRLLFDLRERTARQAIRMLRDPALATLPETERSAAAQLVLAPLSRRAMDRVLAEPSIPTWVVEACSADFVARRGLQRVLRAAATSQLSASRWRRITALTVLCRVGQEGIQELLGKALEDPDPDVAGTAVALLGSLGDETSARILVEALRLDRFPSSRIATQLENFPPVVVVLLRPLLNDPTPRVRFWAASLLARFPATPNLDRDLEPLVEDADPGVRKAAIQTLGAVGGGLAVAAAVRLLSDEVGFVRAHAVRALGVLGQVEAADRIAELLADQDWWVRLAAKESLVTLGLPAWQAAAAMLDSQDAFARNGAAEVLQNLGILDQWMEEAALATPESELAIQALAKAIQAGGRGFLDTAMTRVEPQERARVLQRLTALGLQLEVTS